MTPTIPLSDKEVIMLKEWLVSKGWVEKRLKGTSKVIRLFNDRKGWLLLVSESNTIPVMFGGVIKKYYYKTNRTGYDIVITWLRGVR